MTIISNSSEELPVSSEQGVKIVVHNQDIMPFPNVEGYRSPVGQSVSLQLTRVCLSFKCITIRGLLGCESMRNFMMAKIFLPFSVNCSVKVHNLPKKFFQILAKRSREVTLDQQGTRFV